MIAYKWVAEEYAKDFEAGYFRIGTFQGYQTLESDRGDPTEGIAINRIEHFQTKMLGVEDANKLRSIGMDLRGTVGSLTIINGRHTSKMPNIFIFCASLDPEKSIVDKTGHVLYQISDFHKFCYLLSRQVPSSPSWPSVRPVKYASRFGEVFGGQIVMADPFTKSEEFAYEREIRAVWKPFVQDILPQTIRMELAVKFISRFE